MQSKKTQYDIYQPMIDTEAKVFRTMFKSKVEKTATRGDLLAELFSVSPEFASTLSLHIYAEEYLWLRNGANTLFASSASALDDLHSKKFEMDSIQSFALPFQSFSVCIPTGYKIEGQRIPSFLVTIIPYHQTQDLVISPFARLAQQFEGINIRLEESPADDVAISIAYRDPANPGFYARTQISTSQIPEILQVSLSDELSAQLKMYPRYKSVEDLSPEDIRIQKCILRVVAAMGAKIMAGETLNIHPGFPGGREPKLIGKLPDQARVMTLLA